MALILRRRKDGTLHAEGDLPAYHEFTPRFLGRLVEELGGRVQVIVPAAEGEAVYEIERAIKADPDAETSPVIGYAARRVSARTSKQRST